VADSLIASDMFSGWGIRTLSAIESRYNPMSYHNGSVWPHDNALAAAGLRRYGHDAAAERIASALVDVAVQAREFRLPELYCGFDRCEAAAPVAYPVACIPQAWAAAAGPMLLQTLLGISAQASEGALAVRKPALPDWLARVDLTDLRVGDAAISLAFRRDRSTTGASLVRRRGPVTVNMEL
jgi:glycogen debranching enzyme